MSICSSIHCFATIIGIVVLLLLRLFCGFFMGIAVIPLFDLIWRLVTKVKRYSARQTDIFIRSVISRKDLVKINLV